MAVSSFDHDIAKTAAGFLDDASENLTPSSVSDINDAQNGKWGDQPGPTAFMAAYTEALTDICSALSSTRAQVQELATSVGQIIKDSNETDAQAAQAIAFAQNPPESSDYPTQAPQTVTSPTIGPQSMIPPNTTTIPSNTTL